MHFSRIGLAFNQPEQKRETKKDINTHTQNKLKHLRLTLTV